MDHSKYNGFSIHHDLIIRAEINDIFKAITTPEQLVNWWPQKCSGIPKIHEEYNFYFSPDYDWYGKVVHIERNRSFYIQMTKSDTDWASTGFMFDLEPSDGNVLVSFSHLGWQDCNAHFRRTSYCWALLLNGLKNYLEKGIIIPFEERE